MEEKEYVADEVCNERQKNAADKFSRDKERLDKVEDRQDKQEERTQKIETLTVQTAEILKNQTDTLKDHDQRLDVLESKPGKLWDRLVFALIGALATGIAGALLTTILK